VSVSVGVIAEPHTGVQVYGMNPDLAAAQPDHLAGRNGAPVLTVPVLPTRARQAQSLLW